MGSPSVSPADSQEAGGRPMRRGPKPAKSKVEPKPIVSRKSRANEDSRVRDLEKRLAEALKDKAEALEQQTATAEILRVISSSPTDVQPVFDAIVAAGRRLSGGLSCTLRLLDGEVFRLAAFTSTGHIGDEAMRSALLMPVGEPLAQMMRTRAPVFVADTEIDPLADAFRERARARGFRSVINVPLLRKGRVMGVMHVTRQEPGMFAPPEIALLETFADQAVIAIENVRLFNETKEALEQQTATGEILRVISSSPTDVQPVFDIIAANAKRLCDARECAVFKFDGDLIHLVAHADIGAEWTKALRSAYPRRPGRGMITARAIQMGSAVHVPDVQADPEFDLTEAAQASGVRTTLSVPMIREGEVIGAITVDRRELKPFLDKEIGLVKTFADQAVIAIENVRLFKELQTSNRELTTALDQQTATSDILKVISSSPTDVQPVFDAIVQSGLRLLGGHSAVLLLVRDDRFHLAAYTSTTAAGDNSVARAFPAPVGDWPAGHRAVLELRPVVVEDAEREPGVTAAMRETIRARGWRSSLAMPMIKGADAIGLVNITRREPGSFAAAEIALLQTFADQAVIAIENVRLFNETKEALEQKTATSEILAVISQSPTDVQPVFDTIVRSAVRLCNGVLGNVLRYDGQVVSMAAEHNLREEGLEALRRLYPGPLISDSLPGRALLTRAVVHVHDVANDTELPAGASLARAGGFRTAISVPMLREGEPIGTINVARREVQPFSQTEIDLLKTFADQAVIAIENVRLFKELEAKNRDLTTALDRETSTSEILRVISSSPTDVQPVFDAILHSGVALCGAVLGAIFRLDGDLVHLVGIPHPTPEVVAALYPAAVTAPLPPCRALRDNAIIQVPDTEAEGGLTSDGRRVARLAGLRSLLTVPMRREGSPIGAILVARQKLGRFPDEQIALLQTFADQAVIAIENVRLFAELQEKNRALTQA